MKKLAALGVLIFFTSIIVALFCGLRTISPEQIAAFNTTIPFYLFTIIVAFVDSFNPCNLFAFILLLGILIQASESKSRVYLIGTIFISVVYIFYYLVMATWLNIFNYIGLVEPLRLSIGVLSIIAGIINCKELFAFNRGISFMISEKHKKILYGKMRNVRDIVANGKTSLLIFTTITLAVFTSFIELACTSGFPIIYTNVLATKYSMGSPYHYYSLALYNLIYITPLLFIIALIGFSIKSKQLSTKQAGLIKFISGFIMIVLGVILLANPGLLIG
jgi:hypothetical protein